MSADTLSIAAWAVVLVSMSTGLVLIFGPSLLGRLRAVRIEKAYQLSTEAEATKIESENAANDRDRFSDAA